MNDSIVPVSAVGGFILFALWSKRFRTKMASFMTWLFGNVTGGRREEKPNEEISQAGTTSEGITDKGTKGSKTKVKQRIRKGNEEPTFSTRLNTPIEDIIEETLNEGKSGIQTTSQVSEETVVKSKKKKQLKSKQQKITQSNQKNPNSGSQVSNSSEKIHSEDEIEHPFLLVKERGKKSKNKTLLQKRNSEEALTAVITQGIRNKKESLRPSIIDHYKTKGKRPTFPERDQPDSHNSQDFVFVNKEQTESKSIKESKKVSSNITYATIVSNSVPLDFKFGEAGNNEDVTNQNVLEHRQEAISSSVESSVEVLSDCSENFEEATEAVQIDSDFNETLVSAESHVDNIDPIEDSIKVIQHFEEHKQEISVNNSHFEEHILHSVINQSEPLTDNYNQNYIEHHFQSQICATLSEGNYKEDYSEKLKNQTLQNIVNPLVDSNESDFLTRIKFQKELLQDIPFDKQCLLGDIAENTGGNTEIINNFIDSEIQQEISRHTSELLPEIEKEVSADQYIPQESVVENPFQVKHTYITTENHQEVDRLFEKPLQINGNSHSQSPQQFQEVDIDSGLENQIQVDKRNSFGSSDVTEPDIEQDFQNPIGNFEEQVAEQHFKVVESGIPIISNGCNFENRVTSYVQTVEAQIYSLPEKSLGLTPKSTNTQETLENQIDNFEHQVIDTSFVVEKSEIVARDINTANTHLELDSVLEVMKKPYISQPEEESIDSNMSQVRVLTLNDKEHQESTIYRIEKKCILQFRLGPSLFGRTIKLYCNYPRKPDGALEEFNRSCYQLLSWCQDQGCKNADDTASFAEILAELAGSFHYYFVYENGNTEEMQGSGYFIVDPALKFGANEELPLDCIQCQTVLAKHLGSFSTWENKLRVAKESGYNVVHFTPIQELGASNSSYSISEQLKLNPSFNEVTGKQPTFEDIEKLATKMRKEWKVLSVCDIVLNHTANESKWLKEHPEATYNCVNCPYMRPAYLLDAAFHCFSMDVKKGLYEDRGIPAEVSTEEHLNAIRYHFKISVLEPLKIHELFIVDVNKLLEEFLTLARKTSPISDNDRSSVPEIVIIQDPEFRRLKSSVDLDLALKKYNAYRLDCYDEESRIKKCAEDLKLKLDALNETLIREVDDDLKAAIENVIAGIRYFRVQAEGPRHKDITINCPLVYRYFTDYGSPKTLEEYEEIMFSENGKFLMAHNGWVMNSNPLENFADVGTKIYIRRELIAWGDSVKLRFGNKPEDCPFLWAHMRKYVEQTVKIFYGVRLDNCHSTPIPVAEYLLDCARKVRPDLYVVAELFTNSDLTDNIFVNRLGITSLIREAMSAWDSHEEGRLVYRYGGIPVGSFHQPNVRPLTPMVAHALFLDLTHDNPSPVEKRSVFDLLPSTALVNMACCASGSNRGNDELVPHHIHVVDETRQYTEWSDDEIQTNGNVRYVNSKSGIIAAKKALNDLHFKLGRDGYNQVYVDQMDPDVVAVTRHNPESHTSYVLVAFTAFSHPDANAGSYQRAIKPLRVEGVLDEIVLEASLSHIDAKTGGLKYTKFSNFTKDTKWINGLSEYQVSIKQHIQVNQSDIFEEVHSGTENVFQLNFKNFHPGSIAVVRVSLPKDIQESVSKIRSIIDSLSVKKDTELSQIIGEMTLADLNRALYRCDQEERDEGNGFDVYNIPGFAPLVYCGLQGFVSVLSNIRPNNDLGHPFCANLRDGNWMIEYIWKRLKIDQGTKELGQWIEENTKYLHSIPRYLIPCYFDIIVTSIYDKLLEQSYTLMCNFVKNGSTFVKGLSLGSVQFGGYIRSADLPTLSPNLAPPRPPTRKNKNGESVQACITLAAGLPHFSVGYMRNWGRDTFIALRGLFILTGRFEEARQHILGYAACLRHGLIPNLLDGGRNPRYNCRDALWWWLYCIKSYCEEAPNGLTVLSDLVSRIFPTDDSAPQAPGAVDQPLHDVIQEALRVHFQGLKFRERNAGRQIDEHMTDAGFNNQIGIHPETGFVFGGNQMNCGTWMDKMGSSDKANNRGKPATPRDGSAVELIGLSKAAVSWLWKLNKEGKYPYDGVERTHKNGAITKWTFKEWADKIQDNFEKKFWIGPTPSEACKPELINKKNIYKDCFGSSQPWCDYQLRCNFPIAMVAAPEMFDPQHAWAALEQAEKYLLGPLGMKTLDPDDWNYRGDYDNSNDSTDFHMAHGFNYHQGPEWVWPIGFFLRAKLIFAAQNGMLKETLASTKVILSKHFTELQTSAWHGLPELTNSNGAYCRDSSRTQAWSMSCVLEVLDDLQRIESKQIVVN